MKNLEIARRFSEMARLLEVENESVFRVRASARAAKTLDSLELGLGIARRAWIGPAQVVNALPFADLLAWAHRGRPGAHG